MKTKKWTKSKHFIQILKFAVVGAINTAIDLAVLNLLIAAFHTGRSGFNFGLFKAISFSVALINSYFLNRTWTFTSSVKKKTHIEFGQFLVISLIGLVINVAVATSFASAIHPSSHLAAIWPSVAALFGTAVGLIWNFLGYKFLVFKVEDNELFPPA